MRKHTFILILLCLLYGVSCSRVSPPAPLGPLPSERQLQWQELEYYAFIHFNMNTFTNREWGLGDESPQQFNPESLDAGQWAKVARDAGMKGIILTAKHHDGFCLWPTKTTEHSVKNSPWKNGQGDVVRELAEACRAAGLKFGVYLSPWDRNHAAYGEPAYVETYHEQLRELLTGYGDLFEVWFDGANGGSGYYGGANETRKIDNKTYYQWDKVTEMVRELQPGAVIFSDGGPDIRWVGNEEGWANETNWSMMRRDEIYPGWPRYRELRSGHEDGTHWLPAEADVSIRPGWYYHPSEDHRVKSLPELLDIYYHSVGRNAALLLNLPVDTRGLVHERDAAALMALRQQLDLDFKEDLALRARVSASNTRGGSDTYSPGRLTDNAGHSYWATDDSVTSATITLEFPETIEMNRLLLQEYIALGQRVQEFSVAVRTEDGWQQIDQQTTIGHKRLLRFPTIKSKAMQIAITRAKGPVLLSRIGVFNAPPVMSPPQIQRNREGLVSIAAADAELEVYYSTDGSPAGPDSRSYTGPFFQKEPALVRAVARDPSNGKQTEEKQVDFDISRSEWKVLFPTGNPEEQNKILDEDTGTYWKIPDARQPQEVVIDLGREYLLRGFTYWPMQERYPSGHFTNYELRVSPDRQTWKKVAEGEFSNVMSNPVEQRISFDASPARFIKLRALNIQGEDQRASFAEIGVLTASD